MRVALVTSEGRCGIAEHSLMLKQYVQQADSGIEFVSQPEWLDPQVFVRFCNQNSALMRGPIDIVHLNYHRGLHSQWTPEALTWATPMKAKKVVTFHDTYETQPDRLPWDLLDACDAMIVHEPCDLQGGDPGEAAAPDFDERYAQAVARSKKVHYWRQGVPQPAGWQGGGFPGGWYGSSPHDRPYVGTCGFAFPWKGFELLCDAAKLAGWGVFIASHNATDEQVYDWTTRNPWLMVNREYLATDQLIASLMRCDATAFLYSCANSGTSGAIRVGIAAGKPVLATDGCRQFRDLQADSNAGIWWVNTLTVTRTLRGLQLVRFDTAVVNTREQDSWEHLGRKYAALYRSLVA